MLRTIAVVTASANPEQAQKALRRLLEEAFPEVEKERAEAVDKALEIMNTERERVYSVKAVGESKNTYRQMQSLRRGRSSG